MNGLKSLIASIFISIIVLFPSHADAATPLKLALVYYGSHSTSIDNRIIAANPEILIDNTPGGLWGGDCNVSKFQTAGVKVYSYITASYGTYDMATNKGYIDAIDLEGCYGVFIDESSSSATTYMTEICAYAHGKGLSVIVNPGYIPSGATLYSIADYVMTDEDYDGRVPAGVEVGRTSKTIVISFDVVSAAQAAGYTEDAWDYGFAFTWHTANEYTQLAAWLEDYIDLLETPPPTTSAPPPTTTVPPTTTIPPTTTAPVTTIPPGTPSPGQPIGDVMLAYAVILGAIFFTWSMIVDQKPKRRATNRKTRVR